MDISAIQSPALARTPVATPAGEPSDAAGALHGLASVVLDTTGTASDADKLKAYDTSYRLAATGQFRNLAPDDRGLLNQIGNSDTAQAVKGVRAAYESKMMAAIQQAGASGAPRSQALGAAALNHFDGLSGLDQQRLFSSLNAPDRTGVTPFASLPDWRGQMAAMGGAAAPVDRVELSDGARSLLGAARAAATPAPPAYVSGSVASVRV